MHSRCIKIYCFSVVLQHVICLSYQAAKSACSSSPLCAVFRALRSTLRMHGIRGFHSRNGWPKFKISVVCWFDYGSGMDALVTACFRNTNVIMVLAWMLW